jgi:GNAT superfamily N-acetyltransferase
VVDHVRGSVEGWLACFGLEYGGDLVATVVLENPYNPVRDNGAEVYLSRYAAHPYRPPNSASYLISRAREWCRVNGYSIISTNAGISGDNFGTIYQSAGFQYLETVEANGSGWKDARGGNRDEWEDYRKRRHRYEIGSGLRRYTPKTAKFYEKATALSAFEDAEPARAAESHVAWIEPGRTETKGGPSVEVRERFDLDAEVLVDALVQTEAPTVVLAGEQQSHLRAVAVGSRLDEETLRVENVLVDDEAVKWPTNYGAWLIGQLRTWATLEGYNRVVSCNPRRTQAAAILARAGFERVDETLDLWAAQIE